MPEPLVLACAADDAFALPTAAMLRSALANLRPDGAVRICILENGIRPARKARLERVVGTAGAPATLTWIGVQEEIPAHLESSGRFSRTAYARLLLPALLPDCDKAIYLDGDLVVEADLWRLWAEEVTGHALLAVQDFAVPRLSSRRGVAEYGELGLPPDAPYFNSGVLVMNLARWREERVAARVVQHLRDYEGRVRYADQGAMNTVLAGDWERLDPRWNQQAILFEDSGDQDVQERIRAQHPGVLREPYVIHYSVSAKPWQAGCRHPWRERFLQHLQASRWFTPVGWAAWRGALRVRDGVHPAEQWLREASRPLRHRLRTALSR